ncbi:mCG145483, partial [Mus musculus]
TILHNLGPIACWERACCCWVIHGAMLWWTVTPQEHLASDTCWSWLYCSSLQNHGWEERTSYGVGQLPASLI